MRPPRELGETMSLPVELGFESPYYTPEARRARTMTGTVVYIHPEGRWFSLEFRTQKGCFRQSYCCVPAARAFRVEHQSVGWRRLQSCPARPEDFLPGPVPRSMK